MVGIASADPGGYWLTDSNGAVTAFGDAGYFGSAPQHITNPVVGIADGPGTGVAANGAYPSGTFGYDISRFQDNPPACTNTLPSGHTVGIVQATGAVQRVPQPLPGPRSPVGRGRAQPLHLHDLRDRHHQPTGLQR